MNPVRHAFRALLAALALTVAVGVGAPALAQHGQDRDPAQEVTPSSTNPTANAVKEEQLLQAIAEDRGPRLDPGWKSRQPDPAAGTRLTRLSRRRRCPGSAPSRSSACSLGACRFLLHARPHHARGQSGVGQKDPPFQRLGALHALDDGGLLHRAGDLRAELHLRQAPADAADRVRTPSRPGRIGPNTPITFWLGRSCSASC